jgi:uncharacterized membrane protein HdeD (DUF308 family)
MQGPTSKAPVEATATAAQPTARGETSGRSQSLARNWALVTLRGLVAVAFALVAFLWPGVTIASLVLLFCAYMLADGVVAAASGVRAARKHERWGWFVLEGLIDVAAAVLAFVWPGITVLAFVLLVAVWALVSGVLMLMAAFRLNTSHGRGWLVLAGIVSLLWGLLLTVAPAAGAIAMTWWLGAYALSFGVAMLALSWRLRREQHRTVQFEQEPHLHPHNA